MLDENKPITACKIISAGSIFDTPSVMVEQEGLEGAELLFTYYPDEISFTPEELIGLTPKEAHHLKFTKDVAFIRS